MSRKHAVRWLLVDYLERIAAERTGVRIVRYMEMQHQVSEAATRSALERLVIDGKLVRARRGVYRAAPS